MATGLGPIEVLEISLPGNRFNGKIVDDLRSLIDRNIINVIDGLLVRKSDSGDVELIEFEQPDLDDELAPLRELVGATYDLVSDDDVQELSAGLEPGSSAAILVFEHEWAKPLRDSIVESGGMLVANLRIPGGVVDEVLDALNDADENDGPDTTH